MKRQDLRVRWAGASGLAVASLLLGSLPLLVAPSYPLGLLVMGTVDLAALVAWLVDAWLARRRLLCLDAEWTVPSALQVGQAASLGLRLRNGEAGALEVQLRPRWPEAMGQGATSLPVTLPGRGMAEPAIPVLPMEAGEHAHQDLGLRVQGPFGLAWVDVDLVAPGLARVGPEVQGGPVGRRARRRVAEGEGPLPVPVVAVDGERQGARLFEPGDSLRSVDWKATARRRRLVVRELEPERRRRLLVALECGRGMAREEDGRSCFTHAVGAMLGLVRRLVDEGCSLEVLVFDDRVRLRIPELSARSGVSALAVALANLRPGAAEPDHAHLEARLRARRRGLERAVLVSALPPAALREALEPRLATWRALPALSVVQVLASGLAVSGTLADGGEEKSLRAGVRDLAHAQEAILEKKLRAAGMAWIGAVPLALPGALVAAVTGATDAGRRGRRGRRDRARAR